MTPATHLSSTHNVPSLGSHLGATGENWKQSTSDFEVPCLATKADILQITIIYEGYSTLEVFGEPRKEV